MLQYPIKTKRSLNLINGKCNAIKSLLTILKRFSTIVLNSDIFYMYACNLTEIVTEYQFTLKIYTFAPKMFILSK